MNGLILLPAMLLIFETLRQKVVFGSWYGGFTYLYIQKFDLSTLPVLIAIIVLAYIVLRLSLSLSPKFEKQAVALILIVFSVIQITLLQTAPQNFEQVIDSNVANSFYTPVFLYKASYFLENFNTTLNKLEIHTSSNMPGKVLTFYLLRMITDSSKMMGFLIVFLSNIGGLFIYLLTKKLLNSSKISLISLIFYLLIPAKLYFFPILNTLTPIPILLALLLFTVLLDKPSRLQSLLLGACLYIVALFEPTPLVSFPVFLALLVNNQTSSRKVNVKQLLGIGVWTILGFLLFYMGFLIIFKYDLIFSFSLLFERARSFNIENGRQCSIWFWDNLKDLAISSGITQSIIFTAGAVLLSLKYKSKAITKNMKVILLLLVSVLATVLLLNFLGVNCGETIRLWIFLSVFINWIAAIYLGENLKKPLIIWIAILTLIQIAVTINTVRFISP